MKHIEGVALRGGHRRFEILDQTRLPDAEIWIDASDPEAMVGHIQRLSVRGAPLIGVAAALSVAAITERGADRPALHAAIERLRGARPTAVNLAWAMDRLRGVLDAGGSAADLVREAERIYDKDVAACKRMRDLGADLVRPGEQLLTHCNAGALATAGIGSALGVLHRAHARGRDIHVWVNETRPLLQGARLTAWELGRLGVPYTLETNNERITILGVGRIGAPPDPKREKPIYIQPYERKRLNRLTDVSFDVLLTHDSARNQVFPGSGIDEIGPLIGLYQPSYHFFGHYDLMRLSQTATNGVTQQEKLVDLIWDRHDRGHALEADSMGLLRWHSREEHSFGVIDAPWFREYTPHTWTHL